MTAVELSFRSMRMAKHSRVYSSITPAQTRSVCREHAELSAIVSAILDEVVGPDVVGIFRPQPHAGPVIEPEPAFLRLLVRHLEPLPPPDPLHPLDVHRPPGGVQQGRDPAIAIASVPGGEFDDVRGQGRLVGTAHRHLALGRSMLPQNPARQPFRHAELAHDVFDAATAPGGA